MLNTARLAIAIEQVEVSAKDLGRTPLEVVLHFQRGNETQRQIYNAIKAKYQETPDASKK